MREWIVSWEKDVVTLNKVYSSPHWTVRSKLKQKYHTMFNDLLSELEKPSEPIQIFGVELLVNSRQDIDNLVIMNKWFVDTLREEQWVADDNQSHFRKFVIKVNNNQKKDLYVLRLFEI